MYLCTLKSLPDVIVFLDSFTTSPAHSPVDPPQKLETPIQRLHGSRNLTWQPADVAAHATPIVAAVALTGLAWGSMTLRSNRSKTGLILRSNRSKSGLILCSNRSKSGLILRSNRSNSGLILKSSRSNSGLILRSNRSKSGLILRSNRSKSGLILKSSRSKKKSFAAKFSAVALAELAWGSLQSIIRLELQCPLLLHLLKPRGGV